MDVTYYSVMTAFGLQSFQIYDIKFSLGTDSLQTSGDQTTSNTKAHKQVQFQLCNN